MLSGPSRAIQTLYWLVALGEGWSRYRVADAGTAASDQSDLLGARPVYRCPTMLALRILAHTPVAAFEQNEVGVLAKARNPNANEDLEILARFLIGCDGAHSERG
jgi:2-polyprenyl-6-methoxyphenol hydroxylase-like FAD-dependent oxidoreductase